MEINIEPNLLTIILRGDFLNPFPITIQIPGKNPNSKEHLLNIHAPNNAAKAKTQCVFTCLSDTFHL